MHSSEYLISNIDFLIFLVGLHGSFSNDISIVERITISMYQIPNDTFLSLFLVRLIIIFLSADYIYYGKDIGVDASLAFDSPSKEVLEKRKEGQNYLRSKLNPTGKKGATNGPQLAPKLVDCRFALAKVCMPLMRELEFPCQRNFISKVRNRAQEGNRSTNEDCDHYSSGMLEVDVETETNLMYVGNDAVHTLGIESFHGPVQEEIHQRMTPDNADSNLRFAPLSLNPALEKNVDLILGLTGMDQVSGEFFHNLFSLHRSINYRFLSVSISIQVRYSLSGSEAMDAAFKDVRASCRGKKVVVRFSSAYHGHVSGVDYLNCGSDHVFLKECSQESIDFIEKYHYRIAAVVVNPMQHFTGINKASPPGEKLNMSSRIRQAVQKDQYAKWLHDLQDKCNYCTKYLTKIAFIIDDIYFAFRTPELFSMKYFTHPETGVALKPNVLVIGKSVAAGYPLSMVLGQKGYLNSYDKKFLLQVNKTVGTLSAWYGGIVASNVFLEAMMGETIVTKKGIDQLSALVSKCDLFATYLNQQFVAKNLPLRVRNFSNTFSIDYLSKSLYNSRYPQYLMVEGIYLGNYSTGKFNINADTTTNDFKDLAQKFVNAGVKMQSHGYFVPIKGSAKTKLLLNLTFRFAKNGLKMFYDQIMTDKHIDIEVSHNHPVNKFGHFWSSVLMILIAYPYILVKGEAFLGCMWFFLMHVVRQAGHFFYEQQDRNIEKRKFGHKDASKKQAVVALAFAALMYSYRSELQDILTVYDITIPLLTIDQYVSLACLFTIIPHYVEITYQFGYLRGISWMLKILTDPFTDLRDFYNYWIIHPEWFLNLKDQSATYELDINTKKVTKVL